MVQGAKVGWLKPCITTVVSPHIPVSLFHVRLYINLFVEQDDG